MDEHAEMATEQPHYEGINRRTHWHISKEVTWGHILTTITLLLTVAALWGDLDDRVDMNTIERQHNRELIEAYKADSNAARDEIREEFRSINDKLDRLIERVLIRYDAETRQLDEWRHQQKNGNGRSHTP